ncbi:MAG: septation protein SpoVG family protein [Candidatus Omnitrophota bacterium]
MKITEVRIFPTESKDGKLKAFATMTFDDWFVIRNVKIIQGSNGFFVAMPSRKAMDPCPKCGFKNVVGSRYCNQCGAHVDIRQKPVTEDRGDEKQGSHMDIAHPITQECREYIQEQVIEAYNSGKDRRHPEHGEKRYPAEAASGAQKARPGKGTDEPVYQEAPKPAGFRDKTANDIEL